MHEGQKTIYPWIRNHCDSKIENPLSSSTEVWKLFLSNQFCVFESGIKEREREKERKRGREREREREEKRERERE